MTFRFTWQVFLFSVMASACAVQENVDEFGAANYRSQAVRIYGETLYPLVKAKTCVNCHGVGQSPRFAVKDVNLAYTELIESDKVDFISPARSRIVQQLFGQHNCWGDCSENAAEMQARVVEFTERMIQEGFYDPPGDAIRKRAQAYTAQIKVPAELTADSEAVEMELPLEKGLGNHISAKFEVEMFDDFSYRLDELQLISTDTTSTQNIEISKIHIFLNGHFSLEREMLSSFYRIVPQRAGQGTELTNKSPFFQLDKGPGKDTLQLVFEVMALTSDAPTGEQEIVLSKFDQMKAAISDNCLGCHSAASTENKPGFSGLVTESDYADTRWSSAAFKLLDKEDLENSAIWLSLQNDGQRNHERHPDGSFQAMPRGNLDIQSSIRQTILNWANE